DEETIRAIREEFEIPERLSNPRAESVLSDALAEVVARDFESAQTRLAEEFGTICEEEAPGLDEVGEAHLAACHLHGRTEAADSLQSASTVED
ncbi:MAG: hypothetical protein V5A28_07660, partial [Haloarculaceae archaeon]